MYIFEKNYPYKLKLLGMTIYTHGTFQKTIHYIKSHEQIFALCAMTDSKTNEKVLELEYSVSEREIKQAKAIFKCDKELIIERYYERNFDPYKVPYPGLAIELYDDSEIIATQYFSFQLSTNLLIAGVCDMERTDAETLIKHINSQNAI